MLTRKLAAAFISTFWLVFGGCGSAVLAAAFPGADIDVDYRSLAAMKAESARVRGICQIFQGRDRVHAAVLLDRLAGALLCPVVTHGIRVEYAAVCVLAVALLAVLV